MMRWRPSRRLSRSRRLRNCWRTEMRPGRYAPIRCRLHGTQKRRARPRRVAKASQRRILGRLGGNESRDDFAVRVVGFRTVLKIAKVPLSRQGYSDKKAFLATWPEGAQGD